MENEKRLIGANQLPKQHELLIGRGMTAIVPYAAIENAPTVDAVEVVRCKDCKQFYATKHCYMCHWWNMVVRDDDFCSYGERKQSN